MTDQLLIYVPKQGATATSAQTAVAPADPQTSLTANAADVNGSKVNLNTATKEQLMQVDGIGDKKATKIIEYRQQHGSFKQLSELKDISGIGDKTYQKLSKSLTI
ncbi:helix-hairpin-helix domain-containing protein [Ligilactobacillus murinus]|uniref:ComEA family DNA-binding protein n=1 Tax=Ligilactobacillus murinus TaxID=1622 RepID=UPI00296AD80F|nr:helix-hairpin-helix domain-containing protein [Ligilactobacillus murinus]WOY90057.1 helix-hairpin-helix domain-containing protein [Ligilactobacillus murinus]